VQGRGTRHKEEQGGGRWKTGGGGRGEGKKEGARTRAASKRGKREEKTEEKSLFCRKGNKVVFPVKCGLLVSVKRQAFWFPVSGERRDTRREEERGEGSFVTKETSD
jgi:hypothetical protein